MEPTAGATASEEGRDVTTHPDRFRQVVASLGAVVVLFGAIPVALVAASRTRFGSPNPLDDIAAPWRWRLDDVRTALSQPLRDDAVVNLLIRTSLVVIWVALAVIATSIVAETVHMTRHRRLPTPDVRGLGWAQGIARWVAIGLVAALPMSSFTSTAGAVAADSGPVATAQRLGIDDAPRSGARVRQAPHEADGDRLRGSAATLGRDADETTDPHVLRTSRIGVHVVARGESIYAIASAYAGGDGPGLISIADEILDLNLGELMNDGQRFTNPALIRPGWVLELPPGVGTQIVQAGGPTTEIVEDDDPTPVRGIPRIDVGERSRYVVHDGDTLSDIADDHLGDRDAWPAIWEENRGAEMDDGRTFDDPNLILPGWELDMPLDSDDAEVVTPADDTAPDLPGERGSDTSRPAADNPTGPTPSTAVPSTSTPATSTPSGAAPSTSTPTTTSPSSTTSMPAGAPTGDAGGIADPDVGAPRAPAPIRLEHAALVAAGVLTLVGVRRRRALRAALPHTRVPPPPPEVAVIERRLRMIDPGERAARIDVAVRAAAHHLADSNVQIGLVSVAKDGALTLRLTGSGTFDAPWIGADASWTLPASVPIELLGDAARHVGQPCLALVTVGIDTDGNDVLIDLEAAGLMTVEAGEEQADDVVRAVGSGLATSLDSEVVHLVVAGIDTACLFDHPNTRPAPSVNAAIDAARSLVGSTLVHERGSFDLRARRTGGEMWEPAIALFGMSDRALDHLDHQVEPGHGLAIVAACSPADADAALARPGARLRAHADRWELSAFGGRVELSPIGVSVSDVEEVGEILAHAARPIQSETALPTELDDPVVDPLQPPPHDVIVRLMGPVTITATDGTEGVFERSKTVELIAWLATHRDRATRASARTALWEMDVRDATFANVVSEARRALGRLVPPPGGEEWLARTLNESLPLHDRVVTDIDLIRHRVEYARLSPPGHAIDVLRPAVEMIRGLPFAGTSYLWPDADGLTSSCVLLATTVTAELAGHALSIGDTDLVFWSTGQGLQVLPGHEELIALRMRAHARAGDLAGVRQEWESYERVITADSWSDGEPAPKLLSLRRELLTSP